MLDKKEFDQIRKELEAKEAEREEVIQLSREIISISKQVIYAAHRDDMKKAASAVEDIKKKKKELETKKTNLDTNIDQVAFQEYVEALCYYEFIKTGQVPSAKSLSVSYEDYLLGLCDLTGELVRKAVALSIKKDYAGVEKIKELVAEIYGQFLQFNLRNGELRKKSDSIKWNLNKLEDLVYDIQLKRK